MPATGVDGVSGFVVGVAGVDGRAGVDIAIGTTSLAIICRALLDNYNRYMVS